MLTFVRCKLKEYIPLLEGFLTPIGQVLLKKSGLETPPTIYKTLKFTLICSVSAQPNRLCYRNVSLIVGFTIKQHQADNFLFF